MLTHSLVSHAFGYCFRETKEWAGLQKECFPERKDDIQEISIYHGSFRPLFFKFFHIE